MKLNEHLYGAEGSPLQDVTHGNAEVHGSADGNSHAHVHSHEHAYDDLISRSGIRLTPQRRLVFEALMEKRDHPTALEVFMWVKERMPSISLATVYNCLEALTETHLIRHVNLDRESSRYCANLTPHGHFFCGECGSVMDVPLSGTLESTWTLPENTVVSQSELILRGLCPDCAPKSAKNL